jgi:hypothetical protein
MIRNVSHRNQPDDLNRRRARGKRPRIDQGAEERREDAGLEQLVLPAEAPERLPDVRHRHVQRPEDEPAQRVREAEQGEQRDPRSEPADDCHRLIRDAEPEQRGQQPEPLPTRARAHADAIEEIIRGQQPVVADQRRALEEEDQKGHQVHAAEQAEDRESGNPIRAARIFGGSFQGGL